MHGVESAVTILCAPYFGAFGIQKGAEVVNPGVQERVCSKVFPGMGFCIADSIYRNFPPQV